MRSTAAAAASAPPATVANPDAQGSSVLAEDDETYFKDYYPDADFEVAVRRRMQTRYGEGTYDLYRSLYKDLSDEMRREVHAKPPPPMEEWRIEHQPGSAFVGFVHEPPAGTPASISRVYAWTNVTLADPNQMNEVLTFLNWYPIEACVVRNGVIMHFSVAYVEGSLHLRNVRVYRDEYFIDGVRTAPGAPEVAPEDAVKAFKERYGLLAQNTRDVQYARQFVRYDGPYLGHLELDIQTEVTDIMMDNGVNPDFLKFCGSWVAYLEHTEYVRWTLTFLKALVKEGFPKEAMLLSKEERFELDMLAEEWLPARNV